jgi:hypothetical protein
MLELQGISLNNLTMPPSGLEPHRQDANRTGRKPRHEDEVIGVGGVNDWEWTAIELSDQLAQLIVRACDNDRVVRMIRHELIRERRDVVAVERRGRQVECIREWRQQGIAR